MISWAEEVATRQGTNNDLKYAAGHEHTPRARCALRCSTDLPAASKA